MRCRLLIALMVPFLVAAVACTSSADTSPATTLDPFGTNFVDSAVADADASGLDNDEARCIASSIFRDLGRRRLIELGANDDGTTEGALFDANRGVTPAERTKITLAFQTCLDDPFEWLFPIRNDADRCIRDYVRDAGVTLEELLFAEAPEFEEVVGSTLAAASVECLG
jgi:hypothetical protein